MSLITVVVPCYNEQEVLLNFYDKISGIAATLEKKHSCTFEFCFVDDGSGDNTLNIIKRLRETDKRVRYISFSRNFGKEAGIYAGLESSHGDYTVVMDADLQDPPELLEIMYELVASGEYDCVCTRRSTRKGEPFLRSVFSRWFYKIINRLSSVNIVDGARDYRFMSRRMVDSILELKEYNRFSKGLFAWVGFKTKYIEFENVERAAGQTKWSFWKLLLYSLEGIIAFSTAPLVLSAVAGIILFLISIGFFGYLFIKTMFFGDPVPGFPTLISVVLLLGGIQLFCFGILGQYIAKLYMEVKKRPVYIVREREL